MAENGQISRSARFFFYFATRIDASDGSESPEDVYDTPWSKVDGGGRRRCIG